MSKTIDTLLSPLPATEKQKGAIISLALLVMLADKSIASEEVSFLDSILESNQFGDSISFAKFISSAKIAIQDSQKDSQTLDRTILDCVKNLHEKNYKASALTMLKNMSEANKKVSPAEANVIEKIKKCMSSN